VTKVTSFSYYTVRARVTPQTRSFVTFVTNREKRAENCETESARNFPEFFPPGRGIERLPDIGAAVGR
jgi:hypothetical protein